jgi:hypothetical protein
MQSNNIDENTVYLIEISSIHSNSTPSTHHPPLNFLLTSEFLTLESPKSTKIVAPVILSIVLLMIILSGK